MANSTNTKSKTQRQIVASLLVDADLADSTSVYVIKVPRASSPHIADEKACDCLKCHPLRSTLKMYGVEFTEGIGITVDLELAEKITKEFPEYTYEELK
jgi:hypothetical protein